MARYDSIADVVGNTPVVQLHNVVDHLKCNLWGKCEYLNPGGSLKDRIGVRMVIEGEKEGRWKPGDTLIEPTSGNTGIGMAMTAAAKGYKLVITLPEKMSLEKQWTMEALGAEVIRTPTEALHDDPDSLFSVATRLLDELPNSYMPDQYSNPNNPDAHYYGTAQEILDDFGDDLHMVIIGAGTGGTVTGVGKRLKEEIPHCQIVGVDPHGSVLAGPGPIHSYLVEGIGYDFIPDVCDVSVVDKWYRSADKESFLAARRMIREEGLLVGGSSGAVLWAAWEAATELEEGQNCLIILPDSIRNYMTKFLNDQWMIDQGFVAEKGE
jgi:cysteine synthase